MLIYVILAAAILLFILLGIIIMIFSLYRKVEQGKALIINKMKREPDVVFTGGVVIPVIHKVEIMDISVKTIEIDRQGKNGLICRDNIRADIKVTFFVKVNPTADDVRKVATNVGVQRASRRETLEELFSAKFSEALKTVGKQMDFEDLYNERQKFKEAIIDVIGKDLSGYVLEDSAIDYLEQTPLSSLDPDNILDAQGRRKIIDLTTNQRVHANEIQREGEKALKKQDVEAREAILALERQEADAVAKQQREVAVVAARETAEIEKVQFEEKYRSDQANIEAEQKLGIDRENAQREVEVAAKNRERVIAVEEERVEKERDLERINRERAVELQRIEKEKALEVERKNIAEVIRERVVVEKSVAQEEERIKDIRATMEADRIKQVAVTRAEAEAADRKIREVQAAEAAELSAVHNAKEKLVLAEAEQAAAEKEAQAAIRRAEGSQATAAADGLAAAKVKEADAAASEKQGLAQVRVEEAQAKVIALRGKAEADAVREKMAAEAAGISEKAEAMKLLNESTRSHEEFRLRLEKDLSIAKAEISAQVEIAEKNAHVMAQALEKAKIDIVGGDGQFFDRFVKAVTFGKSLDAAHGRSDLLQHAASDYMEGGRSLPADLVQVLGSGKLGSGDVKNLVSSWLMRKIGTSDPAKVQELLAKAKELGFDDLSGWLQNEK
ncbi:MAG: flotillin family protein [Planctomycetota bacterium]|nr:MAG: flotillin family protein [Planctomycetota bacterium]